MRARWLAVVFGVLLAGITVPAQAANILSNPGFETGSLSGWTCSGGSVVTSPTRSGGYALNGAVSSSDFAQCSQTVSVQPSASYTLSGWALSAPGTPTVTGTTNSAISLSWPAATGTVTGYRVYEGSNVVQTVTGTTATLSGLRGGYSLRGGASPAFRGLMTWSINWDRYYNWEFRNSHAPYLAALP